MCAFAGQLKTTRDLSMHKCNSDNKAPTHRVNT